MYKCKNKSLVLIIISVFLLTTAITPAFAQPENQNSKPTAVAMVCDLVLLRPLGIVATILGTALFIISIPFTAGRNIEYTKQKFVVEPAKYTFQRPLGEGLEE
jgi:hypothetical protein